MSFVFIRHAQPEWSRHGLTIDDPRLTAVGRAQAERLGRRFRHQSADIVLVSDLARALETAAPIAACLGVEPVVCPWLAELANPAWQGTPTEQVERVFREHRDKPLDEMWEGLEGGESFHHFHRRVTHGLQEFLDDAGDERINDAPALWRLKEPDRRVVVVAHAGTNATLIGYLLGITPVPWEWERFVSFHASVSSIEPIAMSGGHALSLERLADVAHLPPGLQTK
jgi:broad specificity phosphatase PhoE